MVHFTCGAMASTLLIVAIISVANMACRERHGVGSCVITSIPVDHYVK